MKCDYKVYNAFYNAYKEFETEEGAIEYLNTLIERSYEVYTNPSWLKDCCITVVTHRCVESKDVRFEVNNLK